MTKYICVWYWFIFLPYVCPFLFFLCWTINWWLYKQNITWLRRSVRKRKAERVQSDNVGYYHRSKLCCLGIHIDFVILYLIQKFPFQLTLFKTKSPLEIYSIWLWSSGKTHRSVILMKSCDVLKIKVYCSCVVFKIKVYCPSQELLTIRHNNDSPHNDSPQFKQFDNDSP